MVVVLHNDHDRWMADAAVIFSDSVFCINIKPVPCILLFCMPA